MNLSNLSFRAASHAFRSLSSGSQQEIYGRLGNLTLHDLLQMLALTHKTATITLDLGGEQGSVLLKKGLMLHAETPSCTGEDALAKLLAWEEADFVVANGIREPDQPSIQRAVDAVMLRVLARLDESKDRPLNGSPAIQGPARLKRESAAEPITTKRLKPPPPKSWLSRHHDASKRVAIASLITAVVVTGGVLLVSSFLRVTAPPSFERNETITDPGADRHSRAALAAANPWEAMYRVAAADSLKSPPRPASRLAPSDLAISMPSQPPFPPDTGELVVLVDPWGEVSVDGRPVGVTPLSAIALDPGEHVVTVNNPGYIGWIRERVEVVAGQTQRVAVSFRKSGRLRIVVRPWADVEIDGRSVGQTPIGELQVAPGTHEVILRHPDFDSQTRFIEIVDGATALLNVRLQ